MALDFHLAHGAHGLLHLHTVSLSVSYRRLAEVLFLHPLLSFIELCHVVLAHKRRFVADRCLLIATLHHGQYISLRALGAGELAALLFLVELRFDEIAAVAAFRLFILLRYTYGVTGVSCQDGEAIR